MEVMMNKKQKRASLIFSAVIIVSLLFLTAQVSPRRETVRIEMPEPNVETPAQTGVPKVYITTDISGQGVLAAYKSLGKPLPGKVAIKMHMGEQGNKNYLKPDIVRDLALALNASLVDSNTYYGGARSTTAGHKQVAKDHGFTFTQVDILNEEGEVKVPLRGGKHVTEAVFGSHIMNYDSIVSLAHFKGHSMAGFGGVFKNLAIGIASPGGKGIIHGDGKGGGWSSPRDAFFEKIVEYNKALIDLKGANMVYINVLNNLSVSCDCDSGAPPPAMADICILSSLDPVALEKASLDQIYARPAGERKQLTDRIESRGGAYQVEYAEKVGLGSSKYELVSID
jgi:uncharacterized Fe-S center protein